MQHCKPRYCIDCAVTLQVVTSYCPANKQPIAQVQQGTVQDLDECIKAGQEAWKVIPPSPPPKS